MGGKRFQARGAEKAGKDNSKPLETVRYAYVDITISSSFVVYKVVQRSC